MEAMNFDEQQLDLIKPELLNAITTAVVETVAKKTKTAMKQTHELTDSDIEKMLGEMTPKQYETIVTWLKNNTQAIEAEDYVLQSSITPEFIEECYPEVKEFLVQEALNDIDPDSLSSDKKYEIVEAWMTDADYSSIIECIKDNA